jgi:hypothetical protein
VLKARGVVHPWGRSVVRSLRRRGWALGPSLGGGLALDAKLVGHRRCWRCVWAVLQGSDVVHELPWSPAGFSMVVIISEAAVEVSGARQRCIQWQGSAVAVLSIHPFRHASSRG